jgi:hypothetical protein
VVKPRAGNHGMSSDPIVPHSFWWWATHLTVLSFCSL